MNKTWLWWSSGKDSAWSLHSLQLNPEFEVTALVTTINAVADRVAMHAVRRTLLEAQGAALNLPVRIVDLPWPCPNGAYELAVERVVGEAIEQGVTHMAFGDLFLTDIRRYRESLLAGSAIKPVFPLWQKPTGKLAEEMLDGGVEAYLTCIDPKVLSPTFVGRRYDRALLNDLPRDIDPCGENGEFHTFVTDGPGFSQSIPVRMGDKLERDGFWYADLLPERNRP